MKIVVLNASRNDHGNSSDLAKEFLNGHDYKQVNLADYFINQTGQHYPHDQLEQVIKPISKADVLVITTPTRIFKNVYRPFWQPDVIPI